MRVGGVGQRAHVIFRGLRDQVSFTRGNLRLYPVLFGLRSKRYVWIRCTSPDGSDARGGEFSTNVSEVRGGTDVGSNRGPARRNSTYRGASLGAPCIARSNQLRRRSVLNAIGQGFRRSLPLPSPQRQLVAFLADIGVHAEQLL
jgi:hypothetical protein